MNDNSTDPEVLGPAELQKLRQALNTASERIGVAPGDLLRRTEIARALLRCPRIATTNEDALVRLALTRVARSWQRLTAIAALSDTFG